jgi:hypothetical protein
LDGVGAGRNDDSQQRTAHWRIEVERVRDEAVRRMELADRRAHFWVVVDVTLGFPAALLAGVSGAAGLATSDARVPAALLALVAAGFSAGAGFLRSELRSAANKRARQAWAAVEAEARLALAQETDLDREGVQRVLRSLFDSRNLALAAYEGDSAAQTPRP